MILLSEGLFLASIGQLIIRLSFLTIGVFIFIAIGGISVSIFWYLLVSTNYLYHNRRRRRLKKLEGLLKTKLKGEEVFIAFTDVDTKSDTDKDKGYNSQKLRRYIPLIFLAIWGITLGFVLSYWIVINI